MRDCWVSLQVPRQDLLEPVHCLVGAVAFALDLRREDAVQFCGKAYVSRSMVALLR